MKKLLFVKKSDDEGYGHYYVGELELLSAEPATRKNDKGQTLDVVNIRFRLFTPVGEKLYEYITDREQDEFIALDA